MTDNLADPSTPAAAGKPSSPPRPPLAPALERYQQALDGLADTPATLLPALLARDQVEAAMKQSGSLPAEQAQQMLALDRRLRKQVTGPALADLSDGRRTFHPPEAYWWWFLDQAEEKRREEGDLIWVLLTGTLMALTIPLALEILRRLWVGAPDAVSIFGTLLTVLLTASPLTKRGRELAQWLLKRVPSLKPRFHAQAMAAMAFIAFVTVLVAWLLLPRLAVWYNNRGYDAVRSGNLTDAQRDFQRAVALDADMAVGYYHLGSVYEEIAQPDEALAWYQRALEHDLNLGAAYNNLGRLYILRGKPEPAVQILQAGLRRTSGEAGTDLATRYRLLSNLGWAYYALEQPARAQDVLEQAVALEGKLDAALMSAVPHYYLALAYEMLEQPEAAIQQWEDSLRYLDSDDPDQVSWDETIHTHLAELRKGKP